ncbi:hypothetical protein STENM327S_01130 [Streptomyces tendae]
MSTRHLLLGLLAAGPSHGYDLKRRHDERFPQARPLAYGQVYTTLQRLVRDGLAEVDGTALQGGPERTAYRATDEGTRELARWAGEIAPPAPFVTNEIFAKVVVSILTGGDAGAYLLAQRAAHMARTVGNCTGSRPPRHGPDDRALGPLRPQPPRRRPPVR